MKKTLCVILARGGSKGIPKKNIFEICGHPLISYSIEAAKNSTFINDIVVSTDDKEIAKIAKLYGAKVPFLRSKFLANDKTPSVDALYDCVLKTEKKFNKKYDFIIELPCVSPLRDHSDVDKVLKILTTKKYDSVISYVNTGEKHPTRLKRIKKNVVTNFCKEYPEPDIGSRRQDFESCFIRNGAIYAMTRNCIINLKSRNGKKSYPFIMPQKKSINIDERFDLDLASLLIEKGYCANKPQKVFDLKKNIKFYSSKRNKNLLISAPTFFLDKELNKLKDKFNCTIVNNLDKKNIINNLNDKDAWLCHPSPDFFIDKKILKNNKSLKVIATPSTGTTHIDLNYCKEKNIKVFPITVSKKFNEIKASSEFTFLLCLLGFKKIFKAINEVKKGNWRNIERSIRGNEIIGKKIGIFGYGRIGKNLAKYFLTFGAKVNIYDPFKKIKNKYKTNINNILKNSDLIIVCISYSKKNHNFVDKNFLYKMKKNSIFINTSRGEVIDEKALISVLSSKRISCALVDVVKNEQNLTTRGNDLLNYAKKNNNLIITPHMAGLTFESEKKAFLISSENILKYFKI
tara:strand:- start:673 stop:2388 length:1716 start_codon:yes stop_codon:yes gene_type:complete